MEMVDMDMSVSYAFDKIKIRHERRQSAEELTEEEFYETHAI
jgi:hypothetical protein